VPPVANQSFLTAELLRNIAESAVTKDKDRLGKGLDWLANLPPEVGPQQQAIGEQFEAYLKKDFEAAGEWLVQQKLTPAHDQALEVFVRNATMDDLPTSMR
jgi:hypothetical protein